MDSDVSSLPWPATGRDVRFTLQHALDTLRRMEAGSAGHWVCHDSYLSAQSIDAMEVRFRDAHLLHNTVALTDGNDGTVELCVMRDIWGIQPHAVMERFVLVFVADKK